MQIPGWWTCSTVSGGGGWSYGGGGAEREEPGLSWELGLDSDGKSICYSATINYTAKNGQATKGSKNRLNLLPVWKQIAEVSTGAGSVLDMYFHVATTGWGRLFRHELQHALASELQVVISSTHWNAENSACTRLVPQGLEIYYEGDKMKDGVSVGLNSGEPALPGNRDWGVSPFHHLGAESELCNDRSI